MPALLHSSLLPFKDSDQSSGASGVNGIPPDTYILSPVTYEERSEA